MKKEKENKRIDIGRAYLYGKHPLQPERTALPTDAELEAAEAEYDRIVSERTKAKANQGNRPRHGRPYWAWGLSIAAVFTLAFFLWPENDETTTTAPEVRPAVAEVDKGRKPTNKRPSLGDLTPHPTPIERGGKSASRSNHTPLSIWRGVGGEVAGGEVAGGGSVDGPVVGSSVDEITPQPEAEDLLANTAEADEEMQTRIEAIDAIAQAQAEQAFEAAVAAVLCSREPS